MDNISSDPDTSTESAFFTPPSTPSPRRRMLTGDAPGGSRVPPRAVIASPTASGIVQSETGARVIPASLRADGSVRKEIRVRPGFTPVEDVSRYSAAERVMQRRQRLAAEQAAREAAAASPIQQPATATSVIPAAALIAASNSQDSVSSAVRSFSRLSLAKGGLDESRHDSSSSSPITPPLSSACAPRNSSTTLRPATTNSSASAPSHERSDDSVPPISWSDSRPLRIPTPVDSSFTLPNENSLIADHGESAPSQSMSVEVEVLPAAKSLIDGTVLHAVPSPIPVDSAADCSTDAMEVEEDIIVVAPTAPTSTTPAMPQAPVQTASAFSEALAMFGDELGFVPQLPRPSSRVQTYGLQQSQSSAMIRSESQDLAGFDIDGTTSCGIYDHDTQDLSPITPLGGSSSKWSSSRQHSSSSFVYQRRNSEPLESQNTQYVDGTELKRSSLNLASLTQFYDTSRHSSSSSDPTLSSVQKSMKSRRASLGSASGSGLPDRHNNQITEGIRTLLDSIPAVDTDTGVQDVDHVVAVAHAFKAEFAENRLREQAEQRTKAMSAVGNAIMSRSSSCSSQSMATPMIRTQSQDNGSTSGFARRSAENNNTKRRDSVSPSSSRRYSKSPHRRGSNSSATANPAGTSTERPKLQQKDRSESMNWQAKFTQGYSPYDGEAIDPDAVVINATEGNSTLKYQCATADKKMGWDTRDTNTSSGSHWNLKDSYSFPDGTKSDYSIGQSGGYSWTGSYETGNCGTGEKDKSSSVGIKNERYDTNEGGSYGKTNSDETEDTGSRSNNDSTSCYGIKECGESAGSSSGWGNKKSPYERDSSVYGVKNYGIGSSSGWSMQDSYASAEIDKDSYGDNAGGSSGWGYKKSPYARDASSYETTNGYGTGGSSNWGKKDSYASYASPATDSSGWGNRKDSNASAESGTFGWRYNKKDSDSQDAASSGSGRETTKNTYSTYDNRAAHEKITDRKDRSSRDSSPFRRAGRRGSHGSGSKDVKSSDNYRAFSEEPIAGSTFAFPSFNSFKSAKESAPAASDCDTPTAVSPTTAKSPTLSVLAPSPKRMLRSKYSRQ
ncbi:uncharacterized protein V1518DRAFT_417074 [Limtongia smithiae]|uniref:uncharacterized protein n=1 Tax=Limtongia smithiae TaxID=1125753 RepID=UPI0034CE872E